MKYGEMQVSSTTEQIENLLYRKKKKYQDMLDIAYIQESFIHNEDTIKLIENIDLRQRIVVDIDDINRAIDDLDCYSDPVYLSAEHEIIYIQRELTKQDRINEHAARAKIIEYSNAVKRGNYSRKSFFYDPLNAFGDDSFSGEA